MLSESTERRLGQSVSVMWYRTHLRELLTSGGQRVDIRSVYDSRVHLDGLPVLDNLGESMAKVQAHDEESAGTHWYRTSIV